VAILLLTNGTKREVTPANGRDFSLTELYELIGCDCITTWSVVLGGCQYVAVSDDDAHAKNAPYNQQASDLYQQSGGLPGWPILGNALVCEMDEVN
jgi:hypothetical protein